MSPTCIILTNAKVNARQEQGTTERGKENRRGTGEAGAREGKEGRAEGGTEGWTEGEGEGVTGKKRQEE